MGEFTIPKEWQQWGISALVALVFIMLIGFAIRAVQSAPAETPTPTVPAVAARPRPTAPPTFTATPSPTVPASPTATATPSPTPTATPTPAPTPIVLDVTELGRLTTVQFKMQTVVSQDRANETWWNRIFGNDRVLMLVVGNVQAGVDITAADIITSSDRITLKIPHATIGSVELLPDESAVIDSQRKWAFSDYTGLETEALNAARTQLREWAETEAGVLPVADNLAKLQMTDFLQRLGYSRVTVIFKGGDK